MKDEITSLIEQVRRITGANDLVTFDSSLKSYRPDEFEAEYRFYSGKAGFGDYCKTPEEAIASILSKVPNALRTSAIKLREEADALEAKALEAENPPRVELEHGCIVLTIGENPAAVSHNGV